MNHCGLQRFVCWLSLATLQLAQAFPTDLGSCSSTRCIETGNDIDQRLRNANSASQSNPTDICVCRSFRFTTGVVISNKHVRIHGSNGGRIGMTTDLSQPLFDIRDGSKVEIYNIVVRGGSNTFRVTDGSSLLLERGRVLRAVRLSPEPGNLSVLGTGIRFDVPSALFSTSSLIVVDFEFDKKYKVCRPLRL